MLTHHSDKAVASFFTPASKKEPEKMIWRVVKDSLLVGRYNISATVQLASHEKRKIAAFDFVRVSGIELWLLELHAIYC